MWPSYRPGTDGNVSPKLSPAMKIKPVFPGGTVELKRYKARDSEVTADENENVENLQSAVEDSAVPESPPGIRSRLSSFAGFDVGGQVAIGFSRWKNPFPQDGRVSPNPAQCNSEDTRVPCPLPLMPPAELSEPVSCPASISITPVPSYSSSQETISENTAECPLTTLPHLLIMGTEYQQETSLPAVNPTAESKRRQGPCFRSPNLT
ncbi:UNVERIFIED_CONTAM: hypothetical protein FKN15_015764 [Acipenser sinensis]